MDTSTRLTIDRKPREWSSNYYATRDKRGCQRGVQSLKNKFVGLTHDPLQRKSLWKENIQSVRTAVQLCSCMHTTHIYIRIRIVDLVQRGLAVGVSFV